MNFTKDKVLTKDKTLQKTKLQNTKDNFQLLTNDKCTRFITKEEKRLQILGMLI